MKQISSSQLSQTAPHPAGPGARQKRDVRRAATQARIPPGRAQGLRAEAPHMRAVVGSQYRPRADPPYDHAPGPSANRVRVGIEKRSRVRGFRRSFCKPDPLFRCNPASVCRRPPLEPLEVRRTDLRSRKFTNFRTLPKPDPGVSRLSSTKVHELSDEYARQPGRLKHSEDAPPKGAGRCGAGCLLEGEGARSGAGLPKRVAVRSG